MVENKDHYVAQAYLKRFYDADSSLHVFNKKENKHYKCNSKHICYERGWDILNGINDGKYKRSLADLLKSLEPNINRYMNNLINGNILNGDRYSLSIYFAVLNLLNPLTIENMSDMMKNVVSASVDVLFKNGVIDTPESIKEIIKELDGEPFYEINVNKDYVRFFGVKTIPFICMSIYTSSWLVINNNSQFKFLTCDLPLHFICLNNNQLMHKKGIALSPDYYLWFITRLAHFQRGFFVKILKISLYKSSSL